MKKTIILSVFFVLIFVVNAFAIGSITLSWIQSTSPDVDHYNIYQSTVSGRYSTTPIAKAPATNSMCTLTKISETTAVYWIITAVDKSGNESAPSAELSTKWYISLKKAYGYTYVPSHMTFWFDEP